MNHIYRSIWNDSTQTYVAVSEAARAPGGAGSGGASGALHGAAGFALKTLAAATLFACGTLALANPTGGTVSAGSATINTSGSKVTVTQGSQNAAINWQNFSIGSGESVVFVQPDASSVALNRVTGSDPSSILGSLSANGQVFLVNPNGILFGKGASVNVQGLVASTLGISDADFMAGKYGFAGASTKAVSNLGSIAAADGGYVALLGASVSNQGTISARLGTVALAAGQGVTLDVAGDSLLKVNVDQGALNALVENGGLIQADGGQVLMTAQAAGQLLNTVVNNTGVVQAQTVQSQGGVIKLLGDMASGTVDVGGTLDASAPNGGNGGQIETSAASVKVAPGATVTTAAPQPTFLSGTWLIDPKDYTIATTAGAGVDMTTAQLHTALLSGNVTIQSSTGGTTAGAGNIDITGTIGWVGNTLELDAANNILLGTATTAGILNATVAAHLILNTAFANGADAAVAGGKLILANAAAPTGGIDSTGFQGQINLATGTSFTMNTHAYTIINSLGSSNTDTTSGTLQAMNANLTATGYYVLGSDIDATATSGWTGNFTPIGKFVNNAAQPAPPAAPVPTPLPPHIDTDDAFMGTFDGLGHSITGLVVNSTAAIGTGMFGVVGGQAITSAGAPLPANTVVGTVRDVQLISPKVDGVAAVGALVGLNAGIVDNNLVTVLAPPPPSTSHVVGANNGGNDAAFVGGLVGENIYTVEGSYASVPTSSANTDTSSGAPGVVGGLVGLNAGSVASSSSASTVSGFYYSGGLVGENGGTITNSSATGAVTESSSGSVGLGGLVGYNVGTLSGTALLGNSTTFSSSSGAVTGTTDVGGLVGLNTGSILLANSSSNVTGASAVGGLVGQNQGGKGFTGNAGTGAAAGTAGNAGFVASITDSYASGGAVTSSGTGQTDIGGLVGLNIGGTGGTGAAGCDSCLAGGAGGVGGAATISQSYSADTVSGKNNVGGLVGRNAGGATGTAGAASGGSPSGAGGSGGNAGAATITDTYSTGAVTGVTGGDKVGGLVGYDVASSTAAASVATSYTTSTLTTAGTNNGLAIGVDSSGTYTGVVYETRTGSAFGTGSSSQVTAVAAGALDDSTKYPGFDFSTSAVPGIWGITAASGQAPTLCALTVGCSINIYVETMALVNGNLVSGTQVSTYGNSIPTFEDVLVSSTGTPITLPAGVTVTFASTANLATSTAPAPAPAAANPALDTAAGSYTVAFDPQLVVKQATFSGGNGAAQQLVATYVLKDYANPLNWTVNKAQIIVSGVASPSKMYDGTTLATLTSSGSLAAGTGNTISGTGILAGDAANVTLNQAATGTYSSKNVGTTVGVTYTDTLSGSAAGNYQLVEAPLTGTITTEPLVVSGSTVGAKVYNGDTTVGISGGVLRPGSGSQVNTTTGVLASDISTVHLGTVSSGTFSCADVGCTSVTVAYTLTGSNATNYSLTEPTLTGTIAPAPLTVTGLTAASKTYDGTTTAVLNGTASLVAGTGNPISGGIHSGDTVSLAGAVTGNFATADAATHTQVVTLSDTLTGAQAMDYSLVLPTQAAFINPAPLVINGSTANDKTYDGTTAATLSNGVTAPGTGNLIGGNGIHAGDDVTLVQAGTFANANAGATPQPVVVSDSLTGAKAMDYTIVQQPGSVTATISPAQLNVSGQVVATRTYDGTNAATISGGTLAPGANNTIGGSGVYFADAGGVTLATATSGTFPSANANAGVAQAVSSFTDTLTLTGSASGNYVLVQPALTGIINPAPLTVSGLSAANKAYDGTTTAQLTGTATLVPAAGNTIGGVLAGDASGVQLNASPTGTFASANASSSPQAVSTTDSLTLTGTAVGNYVLVQPAALSATISRAQLVVDNTAVANRTYNGGTAAGVSGGTLAPGGNNAIGTASGVFGSDDVTLVQGGNFASPNANANPQAVTSTDSLAGTAAGNYVLALPTGLSATIAPAPLTVSGTTAATRTYNGTTTVALAGGTLAPVTTGSPSTSNTIATASGVLAGDTVNLVLANTGSYADPNASVGAKAVTTVGDTLSGPAAGNYVLVQPTVTGIVNPAPLTATGTTIVTRTYDGTNAATVQGGTLAAAAGNTIGGNGVFSGDTAGVAFTAATTGTFASVNANASAQAVTVVDGLVLSGSAAGNYVFVQPTPTGTITPAPLTVSGTTVATRTYNGTNVAALSGGTIASATGNNIATADGVLGSDAANVNLVLASTGTFASVNANAAAQAVTVSDALTGSAASNYVLVQPALSGFINPAPLTVNGTTVATRTYDGTTIAALNGGTLVPAAGNTLGGDGVLAGDAASVALVLAATGNYAAPDASANARSVSVNDGLALTGPATGNYVLVQPTLSGLITQAPITVTGTTVVTKTYNGNTQATLTSGTFAPVNTGTASTSNHIAGDGVAASDVGNLVLNQAGTYAGSNASSAAQPVTAADSLSGSAASNYVLVEPTGLTGLIAPAPLTVGNTVVTNKTYNGSSAAVVSGGQLIAGAGNTIGGSGVLSADAANVHLTTVTSGTYASANASSTPQAVTVADTLAVTGSAAGNYVLVEPTLTGIISPAPLTVSGSAVSNKTYDGTHTATLTGGTLAPVHTGNAGTSDTIATSTGVLAGDAADVSLVQTGSFASVNASPNAQAVSANDSLQLTGPAAGNYVLVQPTGLSGVISPAPITVSGATVVDKTYNGTNAASFTGGTLAPAAGNNIVGDGVVASDAANLRLTQTGTFAGVNANPNPQAVTANDALSGSAASNYVLVEPTGLTGTISPAPVTVSGTTVATRTYDGTTTATLSGGTLSAAAGNTIGGTGVLSSDSAFVSLQTAPSGTFASPNASSAAQSVSVTDTLTLTGSASGNYVLIQPATLTGFINPAPLTVTGSTAASKAYDGTTAATVNGGSLAPVNNGNAATSDNIATPSGVLAADASGVVLVQSGNFAGSNASSSAQTVTVHDSLVLSGSASGNYVLVQPANLSATISPATLTITAAANTKTYDGTTGAAATPIVTGLAAGTTLSGVSESYTSANVAGANGSTLVVNGGIVVNDGNFGNNYTLVTQTGTGTITPATLTVIDTLVGNKVYDATKATSVSGGVLVGLFNNDDVTLSQSGAFTSANAGTAVPVALADAISGTAAGNYVLQQPTGLTGVISPAPLMVTGTTVASKVYDGSNKATLVGGTLVGVIAGDAGSVSLDQGGTFTSVVPSSNIPVKATDSLSGAAAGNYTIAEPTDLFGNITPNPLMPNAASIAGPLLDAVSAALSGRTAPLVASATDGSTAAVASAGAATGDASASAGTNGAPVGSPTGTESNNPEKRRLPALSGLNISVVEDGIKLPAASGRQSP